jgi:hypothetical protein
MSTMSAGRQTSKSAMSASLQRYDRRPATWRWLTTAVAGGPDRPTVYVTFGTVGTDVDVFV